jgi:hypothetical protein
MESGSEFRICRVMGEKENSPAQAEAVGCKMTRDEKSKRKFRQDNLSLGAAPRSTEQLSGDCYVMASAAAVPTKIGRQ